MSDVFATTYGVELLCSTPPKIDKTSLLTRVRRLCPDAQLLDPDPTTQLISLVHPTHRVELADAVIPAQTVVVVGDGKLDTRPFEPALQQTWEFPGARSAVEGSAAAVFVTDLMSSSLEYRERLTLFHDCLRGVLDELPCAAIHWRHAGRIVDPVAWKRDYDAGDPAQRFFAGAVNVRLFKVTDDAGLDSGELVMDTLGLAALGLVDLQCHFHGLDPGGVARVLYNTAWYLFREGDVIADGHTVEGSGPRRASKWRCQHESSLLGPPRGVLDLNPGPEHAPAKRATPSLRPAR
jgi:hypothetical protein